MKKIFLSMFMMLLVLSFFVPFEVVNGNQHGNKPGNNKQCSDNISAYPPGSIEWKEECASLLAPTVAYMAPFIDLGYSCFTDRVSSGNYTTSCSKPSVTTYNADRVYQNESSANPFQVNSPQYRIIDPLSLYGTKATLIYEDSYSYNWNSPFIYLHYPPTETISLSLKSALDHYSPKPAFNQKNGWLVNSKNGQISVNGKEQKHLFYELAVNKITINRNGRNFSSREAVISFLQNSDFLTNLGFSEEEKKNSLDIF